MNPLYEPLEPRRLLAGVTLLTHGFNGNVDGWVKTAAVDIVRRAGSGQASVYTMSVAAVSGSLTVTAFGPDVGNSSFQDTAGAELVLKLDWSAVSGGAYSTGQVASVVADYFLSSHGSSPPLAELPIHLVGHSRGASLVTAMSQQLGRAGVWVDEVTSLDPHPVDGVDDIFGANFGDQKMFTFDNVAFADDYWRTDGNPNNTDFDGEPVPGTYQGNLNSTVQKNFFVSAHGAVTAYYVGTIDTGTTDGGDHPVLPAWYAGGRSAPQRTATGFAFSRIGGRTRPASGVSAQIGGSATRTAAGQAGSQWANVFNFSVRKSLTVAAGTTIPTQFFISDRDSAVRVDVFLDQDRNPYNGAGLLTGKTFATNPLGGGRVNLPTTGLIPGSYYLSARSTDSAGHTRYAYTPYQITITAPVAPNFAAVSNGRLILSGTEAADTIKLEQTGNDVTLSLNGQTQTFSTSTFSSIEVQAGGGNDIVDGGSMILPFYVNGGAGNDSIFGGNGNDTFSGNSGNDTLFGSAGDDALSGNAGNDFIIGNGGYDRLYGNDGNDTLAGSGNADRLFGGDGDDRLLGQESNDRLYGEAGDDTLIGSAGIDLLDGGTGINTSDDDTDDYLRVNIDILQ